MGIGSRASSGAWKLTEKTLCWSLHVCSMIVFWGITLGEGGGTSCWLWCCYELAAGLCGAAFNGSDKRRQLSLILCAHFDPFSEGTNAVDVVRCAESCLPVIILFLSVNKKKKSCHNSNVEMNKYWFLGAVFILSVSVTNGLCSGCPSLRRCRVRVSVTTKSFLKNIILAIIMCHI